MSSEITIEKDEVGITLDGKHYLCHLEADLEIETTGYDSEVEAPSFDTIEVMAATTTLTLYNIHGQEVGTVVIRGKQFFEDTYGELEVDHV